LRYWLLGLPAGVGFGTLRAILKLWIGFPSNKSGVRSAGNGPAMRAPVIGAYFSTDTEKLTEFVRVSTLITHSDPKAFEGALAVALCASYAVNHRVNDVETNWLLAQVADNLEDKELIDLLGNINTQLTDGATVADFAASLGLEKGVSGYIYHTVPVAIFAWLRHPDSFRDAVESVILLGGDTDTTGAIVGALAGATLGASSIPVEWLDKVFEWPRSVRWMRRLAESLASCYQDTAEDAKPGPVRLFWPGILPRNLLFMLVVLAHGFRRLLPPY
jgi:ADP-ribosylglycohydrolase